MRGRVAYVISLLVVAMVISVVMGVAEIGYLGFGKVRVGNVILVVLGKSVEIKSSSFYYSLRAATCF